MVTYSRAASRKSLQNAKKNAKFNGQAATSLKEKQSLFYESVQGDDSDSPEERPRFISISEKVDLKIIESYKKFNQSGPSATLDDEVICFCTIF